MSDDAQFLITKFVSVLDGVFYDGRLNNIYEEYYYDINYIPHHFGEGVEKQYEELF